MITKKEATKERDEREREISLAPLPITGVKILEGKSMSEFFEDGVPGVGPDS